MKKLIRDILILPSIKKQFEDETIYEDISNMKKENNSFIEPYYEETKDDKIIFSFEDLFEDFQRNGKELKKQESRKFIRYKDNYFI